MIEITNTETFGWEAAIRGMRNPKNSWDRSDSGYEQMSSAPRNTGSKCAYVLGENDLKLAKTLANAGTDHGKFLRFITVTCDVNAPLYWWKEADTYKVGTVRDSCSTMHKIHSKEFTVDDFSHEKLFDKTIDIVVESLNHYREEYLETSDKRWWYQMIQLLPSSYNQKATLLLNYAVLKNMYHSRKNHKLEEWHTFCDWIESLPYAKELIIGE